MTGKEGIYLNINLRFDGKVAVVTGASTGIGKAVAEGLSQAGATVICASRTQSTLEEVVSSIRDQGGKAQAITFDQSKVDSIQNFMEQVYSDFGRVDILVNNAAWTVTKPALEVTEEDWDNTMNATLKGLFFSCQFFGREMLKQQSGNIINIGSNFGEVAFRTRSTYAAAKAGVHQITKALALEWSSLGVRVNCVAPCITETVSRKDILERPGYKEWVTNHMLPIGRWAQPEDVVGAVLFLASPLSEMVTGHVLLVDGGWTIH
jgi:NAD(P)-dependent dehydrogenase (short-subunit alcohol dehydrogenase family)